MLSLQNDHRQPQQPQLPRISLNVDGSDCMFLAEASASASGSGARFSQGFDALEGGVPVNEDLLLKVANQKYKAGEYKQALELSKTLYDRNPRHTNNLLLLGAIHYQLGDFDMCISKNQEALQINPRFAECYGNMANAWKEKGNIDSAIQYYLTAVQLRPNFADAWTNLAHAYMRKGRLTEATQCCQKALSSNPHLVDARFTLGNLMKVQGLLQKTSIERRFISLLPGSMLETLGFLGSRLSVKAYECYVEVLRVQPTLSIAWCNLAGLLMEMGDYNRALTCYKEIVKLKPTSPDAYLNLGNVFKLLRMPHEAILCYQNAVRVRPDYAIAYGNLASVYSDQGQLDLAIFHYKQAIAHDGGFLEAYNNLGNAMKSSGRIDEAIHFFRQCLTLQPNHPHALTNLGNIYMERNMTDVAAHCYKTAISVTTGLSAPYNNLAIIYKQQGNCADAIACYTEVLRIDPTAADALLVRGSTYQEIGRVNEAIQDYVGVINIRPTCAEAHANLASAYKDSGYVEAAIKSYKQALIIRPDFPEATCNLLHALQSVCDWEDRKLRLIEVEKILRSQIQMSVIPTVQPFHAMAYPLDPMLALEISRKYADHCSLAAARYSLPPFCFYAPPAHVKASGGGGRLRVGYVSSDFGNHPLSHLMGSVFGMHDRKNIEVFCYALSPSDGSEWRLRTEAEAEHFVDVSSMSSDVIAKLINENGIQILINLNGYTKGARNEIFALQPAPIQVSYMGFPSTMGASYIHYLITDEFVSPRALSHIYSETLVHLPHCYFVNDYKQKNTDVLDPSCLPRRSDYGLPEDKFIFACFNQLYKMDPEIFDTWCNILNRVPNSALWLLRFPAAGETRLRAYAAARGVRPEQIIFTDVAVKKEHIRRSSLADLFLDTPLCNGHTTGTDVLWAGVPMITLPLEKMATRVAGSLCLATGVGEEMVATSLRDYEDRAVSLALNRSKLRSLTTRLKMSRLTCPLFDTARWVRNLERSFFKMWNLFCLGRHPQPFKVTENDAEFPYDR